MQKIAILTQPLGMNYGGIIQNFALQKVLEKNGLHAITINRLAHRELPFITSIKVELVYLLKKINGIPYTNRVRKIVLENNLRFIRKNINMTEKLDSDSKLEAHFKSNEYGAYLVGSDQTWRPKYSPNIYTYFLDFLKDDKAKRIAYATSFGTDQWEFTSDQTMICRKLVQKFHAVSVRENAGVHLCRQYFDIDALNVLDPTLLLNKDDYSTLINKPKISKGLFTYILNESVEKDKFIDKSCSILRLKQTTNQPKLGLYSTESRNYNDFKFPSIEGWLQGFRDAEFIITDSFHGTVFAIINHKPFLAIANHERGASRFISLLSQLGIEDRLIYDLSSVDDSLLVTPIDYDKVDQKLTKLKIRSLNFLLDNLISE